MKGGDRVVKNFNLAGTPHLVKMGIRASYRQVGTDGSLLR